MMVSRPFACNKNIIAFVTFEYESCKVTKPKVMIFIQEYLSSYCFEETRISNV